MTLLNISRLSEEKKEYTIQLCKNQSVIDYIQKHYHAMQLDESVIALIQQGPIIFDENYKPTFEHVLRVRIKTTGIVSFEYPFKGINFKCLDGTVF